MIKKEWFTKWNPLSVFILMSGIANTDLAGEVFGPTALFPDPSDLRMRYYLATWVPVFLFAIGANALFGWYNRKLKDRPILLRLAKVPSFLFGIAAVGLYLFLMVEDSRLGKQVDANAIALACDTRFRLNECASAFSHHSNGLGELTPELTLSISERVKKGVNESSRLTFGEKAQILADFDAGRFTKVYLKLTDIRVDDRAARTTAAQKQSQ